MQGFLDNCGKFDRNQISRILKLNECFIGQAWVGVKKCKTVPLVFLTRWGGGGLCIRISFLTPPPYLVPLVFPASLPPKSCKFLYPCSPNEKSLTVSHTARWTLMSRNNQSFTERLHFAVAGVEEFTWKSRKIKIQSTKKEEDEKGRNGGSERHLGGGRSRRKTEMLEEKG